MPVHPEALEGASFPNSVTITAAGSPVFIQWVGRSPAAALNSPILLLPAGCVASVQEGMGDTPHSARRGYCGQLSLRPPSPVYTKQVASVASYSKSSRTDVRRLPAKVARGYQTAPGVRKGPSSGTEKKNRDTHPPSTPHFTHFTTPHTTHTIE